MKNLNERHLLESYVNVMPDDISLKEKYIDIVWEIMIDSYAYIGGPLKSRDDLMKSNCFWKLSRRNGVVTAASCYKLDSSYGRKLILCGKNFNAPHSSKDLMKIVFDDLDRYDRNTWMEVSDNLEKKIVERGYVPIPNDIAINILKNLKKGNTLVNKSEDGYHYTRIIGGEEHTKVMYGNPKEEITYDNIDESINILNERKKTNNKDYYSKISGVEYNDESKQIGHISKLRKPSEVTLSDGRNLQDVLDNHQHFIKEDRDDWKNMGANLSNENLSHANLYHADLSFANLTKANLSNANLSGADLYCADLRNVDLSNANLSNANLKGAYLSSANLINADLRGANLSHSNLKNSNLSHAKNIDKAIGLTL